VVSGADSEVDGVQKISAISKAWSTRMCASWGEAEERLEQPRAGVASGRRRARRPATDLARETDQGEALGDGKANRGEEEDWDSPARSESTGDACGYGGVR
jgi:hypothetical protein